MRNPELICFEGLPASGKTTLIRQIAGEYPSHFSAINEYIHPALLKDPDINGQQVFIENDELKYQLARECGKRCLMDRGHLSTVLYSHAETMIKGEKDLSYVDDWYFDKILKARMLPDLYVLLDIPAELSLARRNNPFDSNNIWDYITALKYARSKYHEYMRVFESDVPVLVLDSESMSLPLLKQNILSLLSVNTGYRAISPL